MLSFAWVIRKNLASVGEIIRTFTRSVALDSLADCTHRNNKQRLREFGQHYMMDEMTAQKRALLFEIKTDIQCCRYRWTIIFCHILIVILEGRNNCD